jgi:hypothetical protein
MFWLAVIGGGFVFLHMTFLLMFAIRKKESQKQKDFGALILPRFEIFLIVLALPCICQASTAIIRGELFLVLTNTIGSSYNRNHPKYFKN